MTKYHCLLVEVKAYTVRIEHSENKWMTSLFANNFSMRYWSFISVLLSQLCNCKVNNGSATFKFLSRTNQSSSVIHRFIFLRYTCIHCNDQYNFTRIWCQILYELTTTIGCAYGFKSEGPMPPPLSLIGEKRAFEILFYIQPGKNKFSFRRRTKNGADPKSV